MEYRPFFFFGYGFVNKGWLFVVKNSRFVEKIFL